MTDPITPPPELIKEWMSEFSGSLTWPTELALHTATRSAQWGADQELEACCEWMADETPADYIDALRAARRPKPPSLKEQALEDLETLIVDLGNHGMGFKATNIIRALEALPDD